ncbi:MAG: exodeoxyribonuclease VII large subunit [Lactococcus chungangensis]|jgi:exodeoxyribonuclease VII, large subunit|uniref:Exodeoxyribonuclease 7 large subunit n=2 Tax=Pseudolactococcus chungangensis TaxID=451457 RepID=A0A1K2HGJ7_9LACT|nr:exodeoxyribonuclease VII large subunit [Lactococcus chungangensis]NCB80993.1 exodeoxyribonuclease VII large subunit [Bacilli bacterium]MDD3016352.1 exodeoxyribonuclease VII large subunit [Lactococcus chungangensis]NLH35126.1 exodeoxyribonuclease VII large subunit [Lactococcus chungangensis]PCS02681.1 exodeoxyribonuclease VII large subunit [Lactococcus chungangensis CAU 28 = DSM 22330]SFZ75870.1 Exodeoxyribonuclease VII large subunit [Lactococcus chungangensis CAU 28 = DSM 22330]
MTEYLSVSTLTKYLKTKFDRDPYLERVFLTGEISNFRRRPKHQYFAIKDEKSVIQATMWAGAFSKLNFELEEGMKVNLVGRVQLYEPGGSYSIIIEKMMPDGIGALAIQLEQLKKKLTAEGLFNPDFKQAIPAFSRKIGVVTSPSGAVIRDIITTVNRRFPMTEILLFPAKVQGNGAAEEVASRIREANGRTDLDVLIIGRGGGAIEDLWAFNEEIVVRTIFESRIPVISSVGHETDTTLADFVADRRAATPTAAAELATPNTRLDILQYLTNSEIRLSTSVQRSVNQGQERFIRLQNSVIFRQPERLYDGYLQKLDQLTGTLTQNLQQHYQKNQQTQVLLTSRLTSLRLSQKIIESSRYLDREIASLKINFTNFFEQQKIRAEKAYDSLSLIDPEKIIKRGFAIVRTAEQKVVKSTQDVKTGDFLSLEVSDGQIDVEVKNG